MKARTVEDRYRRLLLAYPATYRRERGDEMLAVALDLAEAEGRDRPTLAERIDLVGHGTVYRARGWRRGGASPAVGDALAAATVVLPMLLAARQVSSPTPGPPATSTHGSRPHIGSVRTSVPS